jgi:hypothetical protein
VSYLLPIVLASGTSTVTSEVKGTCNNPFNKDLHQNNLVNGYQLDAGGPVVYGEGEIDPNNPDELKGSTTVTVPAPRGGEIKITLVWHLTRCTDQ